MALDGVDEARAGAQKYSISLSFAFKRITNEWLLVYRAKSCSITGILEIPEAVIKKVESLVHDLRMSLSYLSSIGDGRCSLPKIFQLNISTGFISENLINLE